MLGVADPNLKRSAISSSPSSGQDVVEGSELEGVRRGGCSVAAVVDVEAGPDGSPAVARGACASEELDGDQGAHQFVVDGSLGQAGLGDASYVLFFIRKEDLHGVVLQREGGVGMGQHVSKRDDVVVDHWLPGAVLKAGAVMAGRIGNDIVGPRVVTMSGLLQQPNAASERRFRFYVDVLDAVVGERVCGSEEKSWLTGPTWRVRR